MDMKKYYEVMRKREKIQNDTQDEYYVGIEECYKELVEIIKQDVKGFISFLKLNCTSKEYLFLSECLDEIIQNIKSQDLVDAFRETMNGRFLKENEEYNLKRDLDEAIEDYGNGEVH